MKQTQIPIPVYIDGQLSREYSPSHTEALQDAVKDKVVTILGHVSLQARMYVYDVLHSTSYRGIYNDLVREQRNRDFEKVIGLKRKQGTTRS